jgi:hypothetical protein
MSGLFCLALDRPDWREQLWRTSNDLAAGLLLNAAQVLTNPIQVATKLTGMLHSVTPNFFNDWVFHRTASSNSSGEQISGHW